MRSAALIPPENAHSNRLKLTQVIRKNKIMKVSIAPRYLTSKSSFSLHSLNKPSLQHVMTNKKVLLRERKRHTARCVVSTPSVVLTGYPPGRVPPQQATTWVGYPPVGYPPGRVPPAGYPLAGYPSWLDLAGYPT